MEGVKPAVKAFILEQYLPGEKPENLTDTTPLISGGILDSLATLSLIAFLEERFRISFAPHEATVDYIDTLDGIEAIVRAKQGATGG